jgi:hypothetical protein
MWIFTKGSFMSVVAHRNEPGKFLVRARTRPDILEARRLHQKGAPAGEKAPRVVDDLEGRADYRYRITVGKAGLRRILKGAADEITYDNFKHAVGDVNREREGALMGVWSVMRNRLAAEDEKQNPRPFNRKSAAGAQRNLLRDHGIDFDGFGEPPF